MTKIIGISGKKRSGKDTSRSYITGILLQKHQFIKDFQISTNGKLVIFDILGEDLQEPTILDLSDEISKNIQVLKTTPLKDDAPCLNRIVMHLSFADTLKKNVCMGVLGLTVEQCYGTEEQKNAPTGYIVKDFEKFGLAGKPDDLVSTRTIMQLVGTEIFRSIDYDIWVKRTMEQILSWKRQWSPVAIVLADVRFDNEAIAIQENGGSLIRLTRNPSPNDSHASETKLDTYENFDYIIDNSNDTIEQQCEQLNDVILDIFGK